MTTSAKSKATPNTKAHVLICGAGIAGVATAHELAVRRGVRDVVLVDERAPLSLTSDKSTEAYRNWWPDDALVQLMNRSIDRIEALADESDDAFLLNRRGYLYATADDDRARALEAEGAKAEAAGAGALRIHRGTADDPDYVESPARGWRGAPDGADLFLDATLIRRRFPFVTPDAKAVLHARRCGWFSGQQLGMLLLEQARDAGVRFVSGRVTAVDVAGNRVRGVDVGSPDGNTRFEVDAFIDAAGPHVADVAALLGVALPVFSERHFKASIKDPLGVVPRNAPLMIWEDAQSLPWTSDEREILAESPEHRWWLDVFPPGVHARPEGSDRLLLLWPYHAEPVAATFPLPDAPDLPEAALRGMATMLPGLGAYLDALPAAFIDGGYYTKTRENRLLAGPLPIDGAFVIGALSGYGLMAACGAAELVADHVTGTTPPAYASAFELARYDDPAYRARLDDWGAVGQL